MMKISILMIYLLFANWYTVPGQIPRKVSSAFRARFPTAQNVRWSQSDSMHEASFDHTEGVKTLLFDAEGNWLRTATQIEPSKLKFCMRDHVRTEFDDAKVLKVLWVRSPSGNQYEVFINKPIIADSSKNQAKELKLIFNARCELLE